MIGKCALLGMLGICSITDVRRQSIHSIMVMGFGIAGVMIHLCQQQMTVYSLVAGAAIGVLVMLLSAALKGMVGIGDGLVLTVSGIYLGAARNMRLLCGGLLLTAIYGLVLLVFFKKKKNDTVPFVPFLLLSYIGILCL